MKDLEKWLNEKREDLPPGCSLTAVYCQGMSRILFQITGSFYGSPWLIGDEVDITDAMFKVEDKIRELQTRIHK
jgi:hypothetical protein